MKQGEEIMAAEEMVENSGFEPIEVEQDDDGLDTSGNEQSSADNLDSLFPSEDAALEDNSAKKSQKTVPLKALKEERSKRQEYERRFNELLDMHQQVLSELRSLKQQPKTEEVNDDIGDDDVITGADLKRILQREREKLIGETSKTSSHQALIMARQRYEDFDDIVRYADDLIKNTPELRGLDEYILSRPNAPFVAYAVGKLHPEYQRNLMKKNNLTDRIERNMNTPQPSRKGGTEVADLAERIRRLDPLSKEFAELDMKLKSKFRE